MKKLLIILCIAAGLSTDVCGQTIRAFVSAGGNLSQINGDEVFGFKKAGLTASVGTMIPISKNENWLVSVETKYSQYGAYRLPPDKQDNWSWRIVYTYSMVDEIDHSSRIHRLLLK